MNIRLNKQKNNKETAGKSMPMFRGWSKQL